MRLAVALAPLLGCALAATHPIRVPIAFEPAANGDFVGRARDISVRLTPTRVELPSALLRFPGSNPRPTIGGVDPLPSRSSYLLGDDASLWRTGVRHFGAVRYRRVYPGIDVVFHGRNGALEYDFLVEPGADPGAIRLAFDGASIHVDSTGDLVLHTAAGELRHHRPRVFQEDHEIPGEYVLHGAEAGFRLGTYDRSRPLLIDPIISFATYFGGSGSDQAQAISVDREGNSYVAGVTNSAGLMATPGAPQAAGGGGFDAFVVKLSPTGALVYMTYLGGSGTDSATAIAVDAAGNAYVAGFTASAGFPLTAGVFQSAARGQDAFVLKLNPAGTGLVYSTRLGGAGSETTTSIALTSAGEVVVAGATASSDFPRMNPIQNVYRGGTGSGASDAFVAKLNATGAALVFSTYLGGTRNDRVNGVALDPAGNIYLAVNTASADFPTTPGAFQRTLGGFDDSAVVKLDALGAALVYSTFLTGDSTNSPATCIAVDAAGNAYVGGSTQSGGFPLTAGAYMSQFPGDASRLAFVTKLNPTGSALVFSTLLGGVDTGGTNARAIAVDTQGNIIVAGDTGSQLHPTLVNLAPRRGIQNPFVTRLNASGSEILFSTYFGGNGLEMVSGMALDAAGNPHVAGETSARDFPVANARQGAYAGGLNDGFVFKIDLDFFPRMADSPVAHAATFERGAVAPGEIVSIFGADIGPIFGVGGVLDAAGLLQTLVGGVRVLFDGVPAPLFFVRYDQVNAQAPYSVAGKSSVEMVVEFAGKTSNRVRVPVAPSAPGLFAFENGARAIVLNGGAELNTRSTPAAPGSVVVFYATGEGLTDPPSVEGKPATAPFPQPVLPVSLTAGGKEIPLSFKNLAPGFAGLLQLNGQLPPDVTVGGAVPVVLRIGDATSPAGVMMAIGSKFTLSNLRAGPAVNSGNTSQLPIEVDYEDQSGASSDGRLDYVVNINNGELRALGGVAPQVSGQTAGTLRFTLNFPFTFRRNQTAPIVLTLTNRIGIQSNAIVGEFRTPP